MHLEDKYTIEYLSELVNFQLVNNEVFAGLIDLGGVDFASQMIEQYEMKARLIIDEIDDTVKRKKTSETYQLAHNLRGSSLYIGTERMVAITTYIFGHARKRNIPPLKDAVEEMRNIFEECRVQLNDLIEEAILINNK